MKDQHGPNYKNGNVDGISKLTSIQIFFAKIFPRFFFLQYIKYRIPPVIFEFLKIFKSSFHIFCDISYN